MSFLSAILEYKFIILFYAIIVFIVVYFRKKFDFQAKFIALYRTKFGIKFMERFANRHSELVRIIGLVAIGAAYMGMIFIVFFIFKGFYSLFFIPDAPPVLSPVIPGVPIPGSPIFVPFWYGIIALFIVVVFHEAGHGVVALANKVKVDHTGIVFFGPLIGAFVEPDEKELKKKSDVVQYSIFAAGPFANMILTAIILLLFVLAFNPLIDANYDSVGIYFKEIQEGYPAELAGVLPNEVYTSLNGEEILAVNDFVAILDDVRPGENVTLSNSNYSHVITTEGSPDDPSKGYLGVMGIQNKVVLRNPKLRIPFKGFMWFYGLLQWVAMLSLGIGLANLLPLGPVDGGRMLSLSLQKIKGKDKGIRIFTKITALFILLMLILVFVPIIKAVVGL
ncbi:MAG: site-2 protease family protein [Nanoarchaeota archaeon]|nr:site-2 protease family protein [Nanoarchaeota archaeon]MBU1031284.1 site-2 protease family protein [Nanoarchaeota archaeon]MBU1849514.1 site-2 protease family protein [Nanoarchaeota archaeon]